MSEAENFCKKLSIEYDKELEPFFSKGKEVFKENKFIFTNRERLIKLNNEYNIFRHWFDDVLKAAEIIDKDDDLLLYIAVLYSIIKEQAPVSILPAPDRQRIDTDFAPLFAIFFFAENMIADMEKRGLPYDVISDTLYGFDAEMDDYYDMFGRSGMRRYVSWFLYYVKHEMIRVGRFLFQFTTLQDNIRVYRRDNDVKILIDGEYIHKKGMLFGSAGQSDEEGKIYADISEENGRVTGYAANEKGEADCEKVILEGYTKALEKGDKVVSIHIPAHDSMTKEICLSSYRRAAQLIRQCYPEFDFKAFYCTSWMLEKRLKDIVGKETNITRFADDYVCYPKRSDGTWIYPFLFHMEKSIEPSLLPEDTSMQRAVKKYLCEGNYFYEKGGVLFVDCLEEKQ